MLTIYRVDRKRLARLLALMAIGDSLEPQTESADEVKAKVMELSEDWAIRSFLVQQEIVEDPPTNSPRLHAGMFLRPLENSLSLRLAQMRSAVGGTFRISLAFRMDGSVASISALDTRTYRIEIGLGLMVPALLGAITLSQAGAEASAALPDPFNERFGRGATEIYASQGPLLQALEAGATSGLLPVDPWRRLLAYELFSKAVEFALLHEFGHAVRGHLEFLATYGFPLSRSADHESPGAIDPLTHQLLESQADDHASAFVVAKWKHLATGHRFEDGPLMLSRYGFSVTRPEHAHLIQAYAFILLFFVLDAADRGVELVRGGASTRVPLYPTAAYRSWRALRWQTGFNVAPVPWRTCIERVRNDLAADHFPHAAEAFGNGLDTARLETYDELLSTHSRDNAEGRALMAHEKLFGQTFRPGTPLARPHFWGEGSPS